jgi:hypothetical protein
MSGAEAVALVGLFASIAQLADLSKKILSAVEECREKNSNIKDGMSAIGRECAIIQAALLLIDTWVDRELRGSSTANAQAQTLQSAIGQYAPVLETLLTELEEVKGSLRKRLKYIWSDGRMKALLDEIRWQGNALQLLVSAMRLSVTNPSLMALPL